MPRTAAESAGLHRVPVVFAKDVADALGVATKTIYRRLAIYRDDPKDPRGLPHLVRLGPPWRIPATAAEALLGTS